MATTNTTASTSMQSYQKEVYGEVKKLTPKRTEFTEKAPFSARDRLGRTFNEPIVMAEESGYSFSSSSTDLSTLQGSIAAEMPEASAAGCEIMLQTRASYKSLNTARKQGKASYGRFAGQLLMNMKQSHDRINELALVNGGRNIGIVSSVADGGAGVATITLTAASWIPGAFIGRKNMAIDVYDTTGATKRNATTDVVVTSVTPTLTGPVIAVSGLEAELDTIVATDIMYVKGSKGNLCTGATEIASLTSGDTYLGIDVDDHPDLWSGQSVAVGGDLSFAKINEGLTAASMRGGHGDYCVLLSPVAWRDLADDLDGLVSLDSSRSTSKNEIGQREVAYATDSGSVMFKSSLYMRQSEALAFPVEGVKRVGSVDHRNMDESFDDTSQGESKGFELENLASYEFRKYSDQYLHTTEVPSFVIFTGIT